MSVERAGWMTTHPLTQQPVEVVPREWLDDVTAEIARLRDALADMTRQKDEALNHLSPKAEESMLSRGKHA